MTAREKYKRQSIIELILLLIVIVLLNVVASAFYFRLDLTKEKRFTLTVATKQLLRNLEDVVHIKVYLDGELPADFKRLRNATRDMLNEFRAYSGKKLEYTFINLSDIEDNKERNEYYRQLTDKGLKPVRLEIRQQGAQTQKIIFPGAIVTYRNRELPIDLLQGQRGLMSEQEILNNSIANLEFTLAHGISKSLRPDKPRIAITYGHGELEPRLLADFTTELSRYYEIDWINLPNEVGIHPLYAALIIPKPTFPFSEKEKFKIDQYIMNGGKVLWLIEAIGAEMDSLENITEFMAMPYEPIENPLNLGDMLFRYGVRINLDLVQDLMCSVIPIKVGEAGNVPQFRPFSWYYFPLVMPAGNHPIAKNLDAVLLRFSNTIDAVGSGNIKKTVLLYTSKHSRAVRMPARVSLNILRHPLPPEMFNKPHLPVAVLLEGQFTSHYRHRLDPDFERILRDSLKLPFRETSPPTRMIVVSDGDIVRNETDRYGNILPLGYYRYTGQTFANKEFLLNAVEYLIDESGITAARAREIKLRMLDAVKVKNERLRWQMINLLGPVVALLAFGAIFNFIRTKKFGKPM